MSSRTLGLLAALVLAALLGAGSCGGDGDDGTEPEDFAKFADKIADAAKEGDIEFFLARLGGEPYTCTEDDARYTPAPGGPETELCLRAGEQFDGVFLGSYPGASFLTTEERLGQDIRRFFELASPDEEDQYGPGGARLYAIAKPGEGEDPARRVSLLTALIPTTLVASPYGRTVRALYWEYQAARWMIVGEVGALPPLAVDLIEPSLVPRFLSDWTRYGAGEPAAGAA
jgi:hypothetical protein